MWGSVQGWLISVVLAAAYCYGLFYLASSVNTPTALTAFGKDPRNLAVADLPRVPGSIIAASETGDAGEPYARAITAVMADKEAYARFISRGREDEVNDLAAIRMVVEGAKRSSMNLFAGRPGEVIGYKSMPEPLEAIDLAGRATHRAATVLVATDPKRARELYEAVFSLGAKLYAERLTFSEASVGLGLMSEAGAGLVNLPADALPAAERDALKSFNGERAEFFKARLEPVWKIIGGIDLARNDRTAGDMFHLAKNAKDRMWRVESILKVGRYRFSASRPADQSRAQILLDELAEDPDPIIKTAVRKAHDLTLAEFKGIGT